jgi:hypothetical protein
MNHTELIVEARQFIDDLLEKCEGELYTAIDLETLQPNDLGLRALRLAELMDAALAREPAGLVERFRGLLRKAR